SHTDEKRTDQSRYFVRFFIKREMASVEDMNLSLWQIAAIRISFCYQKRWVVAPPHHQGDWLVFPEPRFPGRVTTDVCAVVIKGIALDVDLAWFAQERNLVVP